MGARARVVGLMLVAVGLSVGLTACMGQWFTPPPSARLIISDPVSTGGRYEVLISVVDMPAGGVAGIKVGTLTNKGIEFTDNVVTSTITAVGLSGFTVTSQQYAAGPPLQGCLLAVNAATGVEAGPIVKLTFEATGTPTVTVDDSRVELSDDLPAWIVPWALETGAAYYAK